MPTKPIADDIPTSRAWKEGRRIYVTSDYGSPLAGALYEAGGKWDRDARARWFGSSKLEIVLAVLCEHLPAEDEAAQAKADRRAIVEEIKARGHWVKIPKNMLPARTRAKDLGAVFDGDRAEWALPDRETALEVMKLVSDARRAQDQRRKASKEATAAVTDEDVIAASGRATVGEPITTRRELTGYAPMTRREVTDMFRVGSVHQMGPTNRYLILTLGRAEFLSEDDLEDMGYPGSKPRWVVELRVIQVKPTEQDLAANAERAALSTLAKELVDLFAALQDAPATPAGTQESWSNVTGQTISRDGIATGYRDGSLILDGDRVIYQHPGYYDEYRRHETATDDPEVVARVHAVIESGDRTISVDRHTYTIRSDA
jgi:hypothetical protein